MNKEIFKKLVDIQHDLKAPKNQRNNFGNYNYRNCEDILEALKPLLKIHECIINMTDKIEIVGDRYYVCATAKVLALDGSSVETTAYAREALTKKGMDDSQITGAASSYARKYALNGLFGIDDTKDADSDKPEKKEPVKQQTKQSNDQPKKQSNDQPKNEPTEKQRKAIWAIANKIWPGETSKMLKEFCAGMRLPESSKDMSRKNATDLIEALKGIQQ